MNRTIRGLVALSVAMLFFVPLVPTTAMTAGTFEDGGTGVARASILVDRSVGPLFNSTPVEVNETMYADSTSWPTQRNLVRDDQGTIHVVFRDNDEIYYSNSMDNGKTWSSPVNVSNDTASFDSHTPAIAMNGTAVHVVWVDWTAVGGDNEHVRFRTTTDNGTTWTPTRDSAPTNIDTNTARPYYPSIAANNATNVYVTWMRNENNGEGGDGPEDVIYFSRSINSGSSFTAGTVMSNGGYDSERTTVEAQGSTVVLAWEERVWDGDLEPYVRTSTNGGQSFGWGVRLMQDGNEDLYPTIGLNDQNITVMWQNDGASSDLFFRNSTNGGANWNPAWGAPYTFRQTAANERMPQLTNDGDDLICMYTSDTFNANYDLLMAMKTPDANWGPSSNITSDNNGNLWPSLKARSSDKIIEWVWTNNTTAPHTVLYSSLSIPSLDWTGETGYTTDGVEPDIGVTGHTFEFKVEYTDPTDDAPSTGYPEILIDMDMNDVFDLPGERFQMVEENAADTIYADGKVYTHAAKFNHVGVSKYLIRAKDVTDLEAVGAPTKETQGPTISDFNEPPRLDWTGEMGYGNDGLDPETGSPLIDYIFRIRYTDIYNESPSAGFPILMLDMNGDGDFDDPEDENRTMDEETTDDVTFDNGKIFTLTSNFLPGQYNYKFYVEDIYGFTNMTEQRPGPDVGWVGQIPTLAVTGETGYEADGVDPDTGYDTTEFTFKVKFTDVDGDLPLDGYPLVGIDIDLSGTIDLDEKFVMEEGDEADNVTTDGKIFTYNIVFGALGTYKYSFEAIDANYASAVPINFTGPDVNLVNTPPKLSWLGTAGFDTDGLEPELGFLNLTPFEYKVVYEDADDHAPSAGYPKVWVDLNRDGSDNSSEWFEMDEVDPADMLYSDGKLFTYVTTLSELGMYNYRFMALDNMQGLATGTPNNMKNGPVVEIPPNMPPTLVWADMDLYNGTGVNPGIGDLEVDFVYKVKYLDPDGNPPQSGWPRIYIDEEGDGMYTGPLDIIATMTEEDANDTDFKDGKVYVFTTKLSVLGNNYTYMFRAMDIVGAEASASGSLHGMVFDGPIVAINERPIMKFAGTSGFENEGVDPDSGMTGTEFLFRVIYKDVENDTPLDDKVYLLIDFDKDGDIDLSDIRKEMFEEDPTDTNYSNGKEYWVTHAFNTAGTYGYLFEAQDTALNFAGGPASAYLLGPVVEDPMPNQEPVLKFTGEVNFEFDGVHPYSGKTGTKFIFRVRYIDVDNDAPVNDTPSLNLGGMDPIVMNELDPTDMNYADGKLYTVDVVLEKEGTNTYSFYVKNVLGQETILGPVEGPVVVKEKKTTPTEPTSSYLLEDWMWLILVIVAAILCVVIGYSAGSPKKVPPQRPPVDDTADYPEYRDDTGLGPEMHEDLEPEPEPEPELEPEPEYGTDPGPEVAPGADLGADAEQPAEAGEDAEAPVEETPEEPPAEEGKSDHLEAKQDETEAPAEDTETTTEEAKDNVDEDIDDILKKLESGE